MDAGQPCTDCAALIGSPIANEPHSSLQLRSAMVLALGESQYYQCESCGKKLVRKQEKHDPGMRWRLV